MKEQLEKIISLKTTRREQLNRIRNRYIKVIYLDLINGKSIRDIHKSIRIVTKTFEQKYNLVDKKLENFAINVAKKSKNELQAFLLMPIYKNISADEKIDKISSILGEDKLYTASKKPIYDNIQTLESLKKKDVINDTIKMNRMEEKVFYCASSHNDCAEDHKDWQGKIYIDEKWRNIVKDDDLKKRIAKYVDEHKIKTFQWVIGKPVWFVTRPNCRHYFKEIGSEYVLSHSVDGIIRNHKMHTKIGKQQFATIKHRIDNGWYTQENIDNIINQYEERLQYHQTLYDAYKTPTLKRLIEKDKLLIKKWKEYLLTR